jgi:hypothetical protein
MTMAHFYGDLQGSRGEATRCGTKASGIDAHIRGWHTGVSVRLAHVDGVDVVRVYRTSGSSGAGSDTLIAEWRAAESIDYPALESVR